MARFTVADCLEVIENRYELTLSAAIRARQIEHGEASLLDADENDKSAVLALREIAENKINRNILKHVE
ncbi:MAG: DNA-directed RNA polymerase subunit omega [Burkholderiales bacterium]|nr:DNA-directed RNA polymerase subunit omega [Burkholderiales bacterium]